ncbi:CDP-diacylglycerol--serine O-phosphatidyltransferase [Porticoccaceae bacterium LTM1]|nr:CDP-diacylglycerol--serine O-phosphatidyltransferase [Porticoccaceae bacterium LTM1]
MNNENDNQIIEHDEITGQSTCQSASSEADDSSPIQEHEEEETVNGRSVRRRGVYLLPNLLTTGALFSGFYAILSAMAGNFEAAAIAIFVAMVFDGLDGRVARLTNTQSAFGVQYDSLSDMVSFGVAPAVVSFSWALHSLGKVGWAMAFIYISCAALRLARFNTQVGSVDSRFFIGLASPAAAALVAGMVWAGHDAEPGVTLSIVAAVTTAMAGILMVLNVRYISFKGVDLRGRVPFVRMLIAIMVIIIVTVNPPVVLLVLGAAYALSGPIQVLLRKMRKK